MVEEFSSIVFEGGYTSELVLIKQLFCTRCLLDHTVYQQTGEKCTQIQDIGRLFQACFRELTQLVNLSVGGSCLFIAPKSPVLTLPKNDEETYPCELLMLFNSQIEESKTIKDEEQPAVQPIM